MALLVDRRQVGRRGVGDGGSDIKSHDQVAVAVVWRERGGESSIRFVDQEKLLVCECREVAHLCPHTP